MSNTPEGIMFLTSDIKRTRQVIDQEVPGSIPDIPTFLELGPLLESHFEFVWLTDVLGYRSTWTMLATMAREWAVDLGVCTSWIYGRNPIELTEIFSSIAELMADRELVLGMGRGNRIVTSTFQLNNPLRVQAETIRFIHELQAGNEVQLDEYPALVRTSGFDPDGSVQLYYDPAEFPVYVASTGTQTMEMAGELADGAVFTSQQPNQSLAAWRRGVFEQESGLAAVREGRKRSEIDDFALINGINVCVSADGDLAREYARREVAAIVGSKSDAVLETLGMDMERARNIQRAFDEGAGFGQPSQYVSDEMRDKVMFAGTPDDVIDQVAETIEYANREGFDRQFISVPLGPDIEEAVTLIAEDLLPRL